MNHVEVNQGIYSNLLPLKKILNTYRNKQHNGACIMVQSKTV